MKRYVYTIKGLAITKLLIITLVAVSCKTGKTFDYGNSMSCSICGRTNHYTSECRACHNCGKLGHKAIDCTYIECKSCHKPGHLAKDCTNVDCRKCGKHGHKATDCTYIECNYCHKPGHLAKDCTQKLQCKNCNKFGHLKKDCLLCKNCLRVGHRTSECHSCYVCGRNHKTISCRPQKPHRPNKPQVWRDSETGAIISKKYKDIYSELVRKYEKAVGAYNAQLARKANYFVELRELGMTTKKTFQYEDDDKDISVFIDVHHDLGDYSKQYKIERKKEIEEDKERYALMNYREKKGYVPTCPKCGECIGGGCDGHP